jgi:hypothetical protein
LTGRRRDGDREHRNHALDGRPLAPAEERRTTWRDHRAHASFPRDAPTIARETIEPPIGRLDCLRYTVVDGDSVNTLWFATARPGMPVKVVATEGGRAVSTVTTAADEVI